MSYFKTRNLLLVLALVLALVLLAVIALRYRPENQLKTMVKAMPEGVDVALQDIDYTHIEQGRARWRLVAEQVEHRTAAGSLEISKPKLSFYDEQGDVEGSIQADRGQVSNDYEHVSLHENVVLENKTSYTLHAEQIEYDHATQIATSKAMVRIKADGFYMEGLGLVYDMNKRQLRLNRQVKGSFNSVK